MTESNGNKKTLAIACSITAVVFSLIFFFVGKAELAGQFSQKVLTNEEGVKELKAWKDVAKEDLAVIKNILPSLQTTTEELRKSVEELKREVAIMNRSRR